MSSVIMTISNKEDTTLSQKKPQSRPLSFVAFLVGGERKIIQYDTRRAIHSIKVGIALVLVSLLYLLDPMYKHIGENAMWSIMTVVVIFEFYAGATLSKGLNRGIGTVLGGGLGCLAAILADEVSGIGNTIIVGSFVFVFGAGATYLRTIPSIKKTYDYGALIFILTFNLIVVTGLRADKVIELARDRLATIGMGFAVCILISLLFFPVWASDELHCSIASNFETLASCIDGCLEEYFGPVNEKLVQTKAQTTSCKAILNSKSKDESLANFAKWEPWHGRFGHSYPWEKYLNIGNNLRELSATIIALQGSIQSPRQPSLALREAIKEPCEAVGSSLAWTLTKLGESITEMEQCNPKALVASQLGSHKLAPILVSSSKNLNEADGEGIAVASFVFLLTEMVEKVGKIAEEVEELGEVACFKTK